MPLSIDTNQTKRYNLKLPQAVRAVFEEPFDAYLEYLLELTDDLASLDPELEQTIQQFAPDISRPSGTRWTLWVSKEIRVLFDSRKSILMPTKTHGVFVEFLLNYRNYLDHKGTLTPFFSTKRSYNKSCSSASFAHPNIFSSNHTLVSFDQNNNLWHPMQVDRSESPSSVDGWMENMSGITTPRTSIHELVHPEYFNYPPLPNDGSVYTLMPPLANEMCYYYDQYSNHIECNDMHFYEKDTSLVSPDIYAAANFDYFNEESKDEHAQ